MLPTGHEADHPRNFEVDPQILSAAPHVLAVVAPAEQLPGERRARVRRGGVQLTTASKLQGEVGRGPTGHELVEGTEPGWVLHDDEPAPSLPGNINRRGDVAMTNSLGEEWTDRYARSRHHVSEDAARSFLRVKILEQADLELAAAGRTRLHDSLAVRVVERGGLSGEVCDEVDDRR